MNGTGTFDMGMLLSILEDVYMRYQDPKIERHGRKKGIQHWRIRPFVPTLVDGKLERRQKPIILGYCHEMTLEQAKKKKAEVMQTVNAGRIVVQSQAPFKLLLEKYRVGRLPLLGAATQKKYEIYLKRIEEAFGESKILEIDKAAVQIWLNSLREKMSPASLADAKNCLSAVFNQAREWKMWDGESPTKGVKIGRSSEKRKKRILQPEELMKFLASIHDTKILPAQKVRLMVEVAIAGAMRVSEVLGLQGQDVNPQGSLMVSRRWHRGDVSATKSDASECERFVGTRLAKELAALGTGEQWLFARPDCGEPPDDRDLQQHVLRPAAETAGCYFPGFGMHTFKRMSVTLRQRAGQSVLEVMKMAGHTSAQTTLRYTITDHDREQQVIDRVFGMFSEQAHNQTTKKAN